jgi:hypothetical protein
MFCKEIMNFQDWVKKAAGAKAPPQPFDVAHVLAGTMPALQEAT